MADNDNAVKHRAGWTDERAEIATTMFKDWASASQIARALGGVTRNAVIGKLNRLGLDGESRQCTRVNKGGRPHKKAGSIQAAKIRSMSPFAPKQAKLAPRFSADPGFVRASSKMDELPPEAIGVARKGVTDLLSTDCRWPIGDPLQTDFHFCGLTKLDGISYCEFHARKAFQPPMRRTGKEWTDLQRKQRERKLA